MKFVFAIEKKNRNNIGQVQGHNTRNHVTSSQLQKSAWITPEGRHEIVPFNSDLLEKSKGLARRKDAVLAVELVVAVGNQADWREMPTSEHPEGKRKSGSSAKLNALMRGVKEAAIAEFGPERIISIDMHTDESTPHAHIVFAPIRDGKLQAKHWIGGPAACAILREKIHAHVNKHIACEYQKGAPGGDPHDARKAAGAEAGPKPKKPQGMLEKASEIIGKSSEIKALKAIISQLNAQLQSMFSRLKSAEKRAASELELREKAIKKAQEMHALSEKQKQEIKRLELKIEELQPKPSPMLEKRQETPSPAFLGILKGQKKPAPRGPR